MVKSKKIYNIQNFCNEFLGFYPIIKVEENELRKILDVNNFEDLWDYPLDEIDHIVENDLNVVLVDTSYVDDNTHEIISEYRWCEIPN